MSYDGQLGGIYSALQDVILNPANAGSVVRGALAASAVPYEILPAPQPGTVWQVQGYFSTPTAAAASWRMRAGGLIVDRRGLAGAQVGGLSVSGALTQGGFYSTEPVTLEVVTGPLGIAFIISVLPAALVVPWRSPALSSVYVPVALPDIPEGRTLTTMPAGWSTANQGVGAWMLNVHTATCFVTARITRGAESFEWRGGNVNAFGRSAVGFVNVPPLLRGDTLELKTSVATVDEVYCGGAWLSLPQLGGL